MSAPKDQGRVRRKAVTKLANLFATGRKAALSKRSIQPAGFSLPALALQAPRTRKKIWQRNQPAKRRGENEAAKATKSVVAKVRRQERVAISTINGLTNIKSGPRR
jgi:phage/plasmid primase-like uncharacterized protein